MCLRGLRSRPARGNRLRSAGGHGVCRRTSRQASGGEGVPEGDRNLQPLVVAGDLGPGRGDAARRQNRRRRGSRSEEHTSELQSLAYLVCRLLLEKKKKEKRKCPLA